MGSISGFPSQRNWLDRRIHIFKEQKRKATGPIKTNSVVSLLLVSNTASDISQDLKSTKRPPKCCHCHVLLLRL